MRRGKITAEERLKAVKEYKSGKESYESIAKRYGIRWQSLYRITTNYESQGEAAVPILSQLIKHVTAGIFLMAKPYFIL